MDLSALSLIAVGGAITVLPEMHRGVVEVHGWMSGAQFADLFALAQAAPGPNILVVSLSAGKSRAWPVRWWRLRPSARPRACSPSPFRGSGSAFAARAGARPWRTVSSP